MGIDRNLYIGPYVKCKKDLVKVEVSEKGCPQCKRATTNAFCSKCGTQSGTFPKIVKAEKVDTWELTEKMKERLITVPSCGEFGDKIEYYIPNVKFPRKIEPELGDLRSDDINFVLPVSPQAINDELSSFETFFAQQLTMLKDAYGEYEISWGIIQSFS